jgi:3-oxoadipate enol-lactonase
MPRVRVGEIELYVEVAGTGPRLLFISGTGGDLRAKPNMMDGPLAEQFELAAYDQRGLGQSDIPPGPYTMAQYGDDAAGVLDHLGWDDAAVLGASFGGMVAQEFALRHPERVSRLVLACTSSGGAGGASYPLQELSDLPDDERLARMVGLADTRFDRSGPLADSEAHRAILAMLSAQRTAGIEPTDESRRGAREQLEARRHHDTYARLGGIMCPTLVCGGRYDGIAPPSNAEKLAAAIPDAALQMFDGGHLFFVQDPAAMPAIIAFFND